ncbi:nucleoid-associated protein [Bacteroides sp. 51]|uniref:nucleoid-associated protein n=1 Tax=Bacteroides sp. 51 TaxID=2302938 RepID=UPI0013D4AD7A|nr:nucleoid-associated protein [Bacteroides sp. 51]NDV83148.1 nucleoid-associated protein [Bacteroides sp. 51]
MIELNDAIVRKLIFHRISNDDNNNYISNELFEFGDEEEDLVLKRIFLKPFVSNTTTYTFKHDIDIELNPLYKLSKTIYEDEDFIETSKNIHQHLKSVSKHPNIKGGDLFVVQYSDVKIENSFYDAIGIYKIENRDSFLEISVGKLTFKKGIGSRKLDKACLIVFTKKPYTVFIIDNGSTETDYWKNEFIKADLKNDDINNTSQFLDLAKKFITQQLPQENEVSKADQVDILNKSINFFKGKESFNFNDFAKEVIADSKAIESFKQYKTAFEQEKNFELSDNFTISTEAVKKKSRSLKNVIKLDKNFDIHIHKNRNLIEQGVDEKGKYYKVYYQEES